MGSNCCGRSFGRIYCYELIAWSLGDQYISKKRLVIASADIFATQPDLSNLDGMEVNSMHL